MNRTTKELLEAFSLSQKEALLSVASYLEAQACAFRAQADLYAKLAAVQAPSSPEPKPEPTPEVTPAAPEVTPEPTPTAPAPKPEPTPEPTPTAPEPKPEPKPEPTAEVTLDDVRAVCVKAGAKGKAPAVRAILAGYAVERISELKPEQYKEFKEKVEAL